MDLDIAFILNLGKNKMACFPTSNIQWNCSVKVSGMGQN